MTPTRPAFPFTSAPDPFTGSVLGPQLQPTSSPRENPAPPPQSVTSFPVDIYEDDQRIYLRAELPGVVHSTFQVQPQAGHLNVFACAKALPAAGPTSEHVFGRLIALPGCETSATLISTDYALGILTLVLSYTEDVGGRPTSIPVN